MIAHEKYLLRRLSSHYGATGDPLVFDWIGGQSFNGVAMTAIHSTANHGLAVGDWVELVSTNPRYNGKFEVKALGDDTGDPAWANTLFNIGVVKGAGEIASGTWQRTTSPEVVNDNIAITLGGTSYTYKQVGAFLFTLVLVGLALAFPIKSTQQLTKEYRDDHIPTT